MNYSVYFLYCPLKSKYYIGVSSDVVERISKHNSHFYDSSNYTKMTGDWELFFQIPRLEYIVAFAIEKHIKKMKSRKYIENLQKYPEISEKLKLRYACT